MSAVTMAWFAVGGIALVLAVHQVGEWIWPTGRRGRK